MIETMLSIALLASITGASAVALYSVERQASLDRTVSALTTMLRRTEAYAIAMENDDGWSVHIDENLITAYRGAEYATRDPQSVTTLNIPLLMTVSGLTDIHFAPLTGMPDTTGTITLTNPYDSRTITIAEDGTILD